MFYHIGTVIAFLLPALSEGAHCGNGALPEREISEYILNPVNEYRKTLIDGKQKNGDSGQNLPPPKGMTLMVSGCLRL
ncbi:hypothetical protein Y032_0005g2397 [Ancylostoma ceylanicum]|uniref:Uncharacterized protein n=1 Tax=Ancylostoma ceylanicum TaxID=53326 RepID=A0A016VRJ6_9BILA|nr:hypothetical protein Y032_0005g2397 [Ancylostoma ceylanicum]